MLVIWWETSTVRDARHTFARLELAVPAFQAVLMPCKSELRPVLLLMVFVSELANGAEDTLVWVICFTAVCLVETVRPSVEEISTSVAAHKIRLTPRLLGGLKATFGYLEPLHS